MDSQMRRKLLATEDILTSAPILKIADPDEDIVVCTNACKEELSRVLTQKDYVVC
jgi:hypothetical protein